MLGCLDLVFVSSCSEKIESLIFELFILGLYDLQEMVVISVQQVFAHCWIQLSLNVRAVSRLVMASLQDHYQRFWLLYLNLMAKLSYLCQILLFLICLRYFV